ncbi:MAG: hypothetical protein JWL72_3882 [Ilumatobacteraceae bacterium]|nr:hypothetical protein [Ilumatobacteraceae bacterium]
MVNRKRPMESCGLKSKGNRGLVWAEAHSHPGVVPPSTLRLSISHAGTKCPLGADIS